MRKLQRLSMALVLTLMLSTCALAGTIDTPPGTIDTPPAPQAPPPPSATATGIIETPSSAPSHALADVALTVLHTALSLF